MSYRAMQKRLAELEAANAPQVIAVQGIGTSPLVSVCGTNEEMTLDEWQQRYPDGTLIRIVYGDVDAPRYAEI